MSDKPNHVNLRLAWKTAGLLTLAFTLAGCSAPSVPVDAIDKATLKETYDGRQNHPEASPADVTGFEATFTGRHNGAMTIRTLQVPCNVFLNRSVEDNALRITSAAGMVLSPEAKIQTEDIMLQAKNGVCAPALSR